MLGADHERIADYARDECDDHRFRRPPDCVVLAERRSDVEAVLRIAAERRVPVTPRGAGSGKVAGCVAMQGGVVLSTERMRGPVAVDGDDLVAVAAPGALTGELADAAEAIGLFYPPDPASLAYSTIGGNVATNAGGPRAFRYGVTRDYVLGLEVVLMGGEVLRVGRRTAKGVTGYDLTQQFVGSEGTLGVVTEVTARLVPRPPAVRTALALFDGADAAGRAVGALARGGVAARTLELLDRHVLELTTAARAADVRLPAGTGAALLLELDGEEDALDAAIVRAGALLEAAGARDVLVAQSEPERRSLWSARREVSRLLRAAHRAKVGEDICVPRGALGEVLRRIDALSARVGLPIVCFGHAGDGNLHVNVLLDDDPDDPALRARVEETLVALFTLVVELGGTLSGEHGIGAAKARFLPIEQPPALIAWQRRVKALWDPAGLLNPGKIFDGAAGCRE